MRSTLWKKKLSNYGLLYVIFDIDAVRKDKFNIFHTVSVLASNNVDIIQLRAKNLPDYELLKMARRIKTIVHNKRKCFLINDRADIAYLADADGVHLGNDDITVSQARKILGDKAIIGRTIHSLNELKDNQQERIDYISVGPIYKTALKPLLPSLPVKSLKLILARCDKPVFAVGGINLSNVNALLEVGVKNIALCRGIISSTDTKSAIASYKKCLQKVS